MRWIRPMRRVLPMLVTGAIVLTAGAARQTVPGWILVDDIDQWHAELYCGDPDVREFLQGPALEGGAQGVVDFDGKGNGYVACGTFVQIVTADGQARVLAGTPGVKGNTDGPPWQATFSNVADLAVADDETLYAVDSANLTLRRLSRDEHGVWHTRTVAGTPGRQGHRDGRGARVLYTAPFDSIAVDEKGVVYTLDGDWLRTFRDGTVTTLNAGTGYVNGAIRKAKFNRLMSAHAGLAYDGKGNLYIGDRWNMAIRKVDLKRGVVTTIAGVLPGEQKGRPKDGPRFEARFHPGGGPMGTFYHRPSGRVIVRSADEGGRIRMIDEKRVKTFGPGPGSEQRRPLVGPWRDVKGGNPAGVDAQGNVYVRGHGCIRVLRKKEGGQK